MITSSALFRLLDAAAKDENAAAVLHDALLERYPAYEQVIRAALRDADAFHEPVAVHVNRYTLEKLLDNPRLGGRTPFRRVFPLNVGWRDGDVSVFVAMPRWRPRARIVYDGIRNAYDPRTREILAIRRNGRWEYANPLDRLSSSTALIEERGLLDALDEALVHRVRTELARRWTKHMLVRWHEWNDPNGDYANISKREAIDLLMEAVTENRETPEEMRANARRDPPWVVRVVRLDRDELLRRFPSGADVLRRRRAIMRGRGSA